MNWKRVERLSELLEFGSGAEVVREQTDSREGLRAIPDELLKCFASEADSSCPQTYAICYLANGNALAVLNQGTGPGWSDLTPDPAWEAEAFFFIGEKCEQPVGE